MGYYVRQLCLTAKRLVEEEFLAQLSQSLDKKEAKYRNINQVILPLFKNIYEQFETVLDNHDEDDESYNWEDNE